MIACRSFFTLALATVCFSHDNRQFPTQLRERGKLFASLMMTNERHDNSTLQSAKPIPIPMEFRVRDVMQPAEEIIAQIHREATLLRHHRILPPPKPPPKPPPLPPAPSPLKLRPPPKPKPPKPPKPKTKTKTKPPKPKPKPIHPVVLKPEPPIQLDEETPPLGIVVWNAGPPLCGVSGATCDSQVLRTTCRVTEGSIGRDQHIDVGGFVSKLDKLRDSRTITTKLPFSCNDMSLKEFGESHSFSTRRQDYSANGWQLHHEQAHDVAPRAKDEIETSNVVDPLEVDKMAIGIKMFKQERSGLPICGTIDLAVMRQEGGLPEEEERWCTSVLETSCDHTDHHDPNGEHRLVERDTLVLNTSMTIRTYGCEIEKRVEKEERREEEEDQKDQKNQKDDTQHHHYYINIRTKRQVSYSNNTAVHLRGDLFSLKKEKLRGFFDFILGSRIVRTTSDLREDINIGDLLGVRLPGMVFESVVLSRPDKRTLLIGQAFNVGQSDLLGYTGTLVYRKQGVSGLGMGQGILIKKRGGGGGGQNYNVLRLQVEAEMEAKSLCRYIKTQYHSLIRMVGTTVLHVKSISKHSIIVHERYCNDDHNGVKLYRGLIKHEKKLLPKGFPPLPGTAAVGNGSFVAVTTRDLCPVVISGRKVQIADQVCLVENCAPAMLTLKCQTPSGAWMSKFTGVNYHVYLLPPHVSLEGATEIGSFRENLRQLSQEKMRCTTLKCIERLQAMECAVLAANGTLGLMSNLEKNLNCDRAGLTEETNSSVVPRVSKDYTDEKDMWGFFTRI